MKIILITDLHVGKPDEDTFQVDVRKNFLDILEQVAAQHPAHIIINGDLSYLAGNVDTYFWIKGHLDKLCIPYDIITGNHDDAYMLANVFQREADCHDGLLFYQKQLNDWTCIFLDTASRTLSASQLIWLEQQIQTHQTKQVMVFMHHPPVEVGAPFMDINHSLLNQTEVQAILAQHDSTVPVFSGHYHTEKTIVQGNLIVQVTPSCFFQIAPYTSEFSIDHYRIAYRQIDLLPNGWRSMVRYFEGNLSFTEH
jgi:Icc protein